MEKFVLSDASAGVIGHYIVDESTLHGVKYLPGWLCSHLRKILGSKNNNY